MLVEKVLYRTQVTMTGGRDTQVLPCDVAAACAGCFATALAFRLQAARHTSAGLNTEAVVTLEQDKDGFGCLVVDLRASQSLDSSPDPLAQTDPLIQQFERWARGRLAEGFSLDEAAQALATSKRTLARRTRRVLGNTPLAFFQDLRIERAVYLRRTSDASVDQIAAQVGYAGGVTLRALLRRG